MSAIPPVAPAKVASRPGRPSRLICICAATPADEPTRTGGGDAVSLSGGEEPRKTGLRRAQPVRPRRRRPNKPEPPEAG